MLTAIYMGFYRNFLFLKIVLLYNTLSILTEQKYIKQNVKKRKRRSINNFLVHEILINFSRFSLLMKIKIIEILTHDIKLAPYIFNGDDK